MSLVPARYIGSVKVRLSSQHGRIFDRYGNVLRTNDLNPGDIIMVPASEVLGQTFLFDKAREGKPQYLGLGRVILPGDENLDAEELSLKGYEFHEGRPDFEIVHEEPAAESEESEVHPQEDGE